MPISHTTKSVAAVGAGIVLLTAAGGTFAQWKDSGSVAGGTVTAGHLDMTVSPGTWWDTTGTTETQIADVSAFRMVPGDTIEYRANIDPDLVGDNLEATLDVTLPTESGALADFVDTDATIDGGTSQTLTPANTGGGETFDALVTISMPYGETERTAPDGGEDLSLALSSMEISLVQTPNP